MQALQAQTDALLFEQRQIARQLRELFNRQQGLITTVARLQRRDSLRDEIVSFFSAFNLAMHSQSMGSIENLLNILLQAVLPHVYDEYRIKLELESRNNTPSLNIFLQSLVDNEHLEDIYEDNGGALTNVISTGLRLLGLTKTSQRQFIALDETDCWIKSDRIKAYADTLNSVADLLDTQVLYISHHPVASLGVSASVFEVTPTGIVTHAAPADWTSSAQPGIRKIELHDYKRHHDASLNLRPGINVLTGDNNAGKSVFLSALKAVAYNQSRDSHVRRKQPKATVRIHLENETIIEWTRVKKGSPKVMYRLFLNGDTTPAKEEAGGKTVGAPEWVKAALNLYLDEDTKFDVSLQNQKSPVFLLDEGSGVNRAKLMILGQEQVYLSRLQAQYKEDAQATRAELKHAEKELVSLSYAIQSLRSEVYAAFGVDIAQLEDGLFVLKDEGIASVEQLVEQAAGSAKDRINRLNSDLLKQESMRGRLGQLQSFSELSAVPTPAGLASVALTDTGLLAQFFTLSMLNDLPGLAPVVAVQGKSVASLEQYLPLVQLDKLPALPSLSQVAQVSQDALRKLQEYLPLAEMAHLLKDPLVAVAHPDVTNTVELGTFGVQLKKMAVDLDGLVTRRTDLASQLKAVVESNNSICPTCCQPWPHVHP